MSLVLDASLALSWYYEDERTPASDAVLDRNRQQHELGQGLVTRLQLPLYDSVYLELAQRRTLPLATLDNALGAGARALGISLLGA